MSKEETRASVSRARDLLESIGETCPVYLGFEKASYEVSGSDLTEIARALYLADLELGEGEEE